MTWPKSRRPLALRSQVKRSKVQVTKLELNSFED